MREQILNFCLKTHLFIPQKLNKRVFSDIYILRNYIVAAGPVSINGVVPPVGNI